jgi:hypothetical protein
MDPNTVLENLRAAYRREEYNFTYEEICEILENFNNLDRWISRGGFLPIAWETRRDINDIPTS